MRWFKSVMALEPEYPVDDYQWKKFTAYDAPKVLAWMGVSGSTIEPEVPAPDAAQVGYEEGYAKGFAAGEADALAQQKAVLDQLNSVIDECRRLAQRQQDEIFTEAATVMSALFQTLFQYELQISDGLMQELINRIRQMFDNCDGLNIHLSTKDYDSLRKIVSADILSNMIADESLPKGVVRASVGQSIVELDVVKNMQELLHNIPRSEIQEMDPDREVNADG